MTSSCDRAALHALPWRSTILHVVADPLGYAVQVIPLHFNDYQPDVWFLLLSLATQQIGAARSRFTSPTSSQRLTLKQVSHAHFVEMRLLLTLR